MTQVYTLPLGAYQTNCYVVHREGQTQCILIDPGYDANQVLSFLEEKGLSPEAILLTHGHFDHVGAVRDLVALTDCPVYLHPEETTMPPQMTAGPLYYTHPLAWGQTLSLAGMQIDVFHTPGHTPGSVCFAIEDLLFTGDTLFAGSCGRTDLPGGSWATITQSLACLRGLQTPYRVFPGHGDSTTLEREKTANPYLRG
jgi:glyoxylase-like metal-dependent hydrolase (beta-lactamase superfamily II)